VEAVPEGVPRSWQGRGGATAAVVNNSFSRGVLPFESNAIFLLGAHTQALMLAGVVFAEERRQALIQLGHCLVAADIRQI